jgi:outer membrane protein assembly factor BamB
MKMSKMLQCGMMLGAGFLFIFAAGGFAQESTAGKILTPEQIKGAELKIVWENELPIRKTENLEQLLIIGSRIYALSGNNYMISLNREDGKVMLSQAIAETGFPVTGLGVYKNELFSVAGGKLIEIDLGSGRELSSKLLKFNAVCPAVRNSSYFYIAGTDRRIHALRASDKVKIFEVSAKNGSGITSVVADENLVVFATEKGDCVRITPDGPKQMWQFNAERGISEPIAADANSLFLASEDTNVYKLDRLTGKFVWKYQTGGLLEKGPRVGREAVYQYVQDKGLAAIDKNSGRLIWQLAEGIDLLAEGNGRTYVIANNGELVVMDNKKAKRLYSTGFAGISKWAANTIDSKIYIADAIGRLVCLKPIE